MTEYHIRNEHINQYRLCQRAHASLLEALLVAPDVARKRRLLDFVDELGEMLSIDLALEIDRLEAAERANVGE